MTQDICAMVIGLGRVGWLYDKDRELGQSHFGAYCLNNKITKIACVDSNVERCEEFKDWVVATGFGLTKVSMFTDYIDAIKTLNPQIASVCVPTPKHREVMDDICHPKGPQVICLEKPLGSSLDEANMIANRAAHIYGLTEGNRPKVTVNFSRRWHPNWRRVKEILDSGELGKPLLAIGHHPGPLLRSGIHMLDLFNWYFGEPKKARALSRKLSWMERKYPETDDGAYNAEIRYDINPDSQGGLWQTDVFLFGANSDDMQYQMFEFEIFCEKGYICVHQNGRVLFPSGIAKQEDYGGLVGLDFHHAHPTVLDKPFNTMTSMVDDLVATVEDPTHKLACNMEDGVRAQYLHSMITQSNGQWITLDKVDLKGSVKSI